MDGGKRPGRGRMGFPKRSHSQSLAVGVGRGAADLLFPWMRASEHWKATCVGWGTFRQDFVEK